MRDDRGFFPAMQTPYDRRQRVTTVELKDADLARLRVHAYVRLRVPTRVRRVALVPFNYAYLPGNVIRIHGVWGMAGRMRSGGPACEVAYCGGADKSLLSLAMAHELGHCEQFLVPDTGVVLGADKQTEHGRVLSYHQEVDAWHRGLAMLGELGIATPPAALHYAASCLQSYTFRIGEEHYKDDPIWATLGKKFLTRSYGCAMMVPVDDERTEP